jgi:hypothetical protein
MPAFTPQPERASGKANNVYRDLWYMIPVASDVQEQKMKSRILASILVVACALSPTRGATTPFTLTLEAEENPIKAGSDVKVDITLRNSSNHAIDVGLGLAEMDYALGVRDSQNRIPPETEFARKSKGRGYFSNETVFTLQPGETLPKGMLVISSFTTSAAPANTPSKSAVLSRRN